MYFRVISFKASSILSCLNAIIYFANPEQKRPAHITIAGPSEDKFKPIKLDSKLPLKVSVFGIGRFFNERQNTVFLKCYAEWMRKFWRKRDFGYNPHITLYDGYSRDLAQRLFTALSGHRMFFTLTVENFEIVESVKGQKSLTLGLELEPNPWLGGAASRADFDNVKSLADWHRAMVIDRLCVVLLNEVRKGNYTKSPKI
jgi:hypothetical protein